MSTVKRDHYRDHLACPRWAQEGQMMVHLKESQVKEIADLSFACIEAERAAALKYHGSSEPMALSFREMSELLELVDPEPERKLISAVNRLADEELVELQALIWFGRGDDVWQGCLDDARNSPSWERSGCVRYVVSKALGRYLTAALKKLDRCAHAARKVVDTAEDSDQPNTGTAERKSPVRFTGFDDKLALVKYDCTANDSDDLADLIRRTTATSKNDLPWLKLAKFSGIPNPKARNPDFPSLRYDAAVVEIYGVEGDYDGGKLPMATAAALLADIDCLIYNTPSSTPEAPRWRVIAPTSKPYPPAQRARFLARINGRLGGTLADESFVLSQSYYFGGLVDRPAEVMVNRGRRIDLHNDLDALALYKHGSPEPPKPKPPRSAPAGLRENDDNPVLLAVRTAPAGLRENDDNPVLLAEGSRRVEWHVERHGTGIDPRGHRAFGLASWLGDMRTREGDILSVACIIELMQLYGYGEIAPDILDRRANERGCELVTSLTEALRDGAGQ